MDEQRLAPAVHLKTVGLSVTVRRTMCMGCRRAIVAGEYRMAFSSMKLVGKASRFQRAIMRYTCLSCAKADMTDIIKTARKFRKTVIRKLQVDKAFYATRSLGPEFEAEAAAIVKWRVDKITARRYSNNKRMKMLQAKHAAEAKEAPVSPQKAETFQESQPCN